MARPISRRTILGVPLGTAAAAAELTSKAATPAIQLSMDAPDYDPGEEMRLTITENLSARHTFAVTDPATTWTPVVGSETADTIVYRADAPADDSVVTARMTRTWDGRTATAEFGYIVNDPAQPPTGIALPGRSASSNDHGPLTQCDIVRVYNFGAVDGELSTSGATALMVSDEGGVQTASALDRALGSLSAKHPDTLVWYMPDNEITAAQLTQSQANAHTAKLASMRPVVDKYPNARLSIDITAYGVRQGRHNILEPCKQYLHGLVSSCYNPGRDRSPPVWDPYPGYLDPVLDVVTAWGLPAFGCGEFGNPVDPRDPGKRPAYAKGAVQFMQDGCDARGLDFVGFCWWDNQKSGGPNNRLSADNPLTAQAWKDALL